MSNIQPYIILNGTDSRSITGLLISALAPISKPLQRTLVDTVDGRDGDLVTPLGFSAYDKTISIALTYGYDIDDIIEYFNSEGVVTFSNEPDKYYRYAIYEQIDFERLIRFKTAEVTLHCQPFKFSTTETPKLFNVTSGSPITVKNDGNYQSRPNLTIIGSGDVDLSLNGSQVLSLDLEDNQAIIIDTEDMNAYAAQTAIKEVIAEINPVQDLHGQEYPYPAGAGKNLFNKLSEDKINGYFNNGVITSYSGTARQVVYIPCNPNTTYTVSRKAVITGERFRVAYTETTPQVGTSILGEISAPNTQTVGDLMSLTITTGASATYLVCWAYWDNATSAIDTLQIELGSTATAYAPYENICPITGFTESNVTLFGVNIWDEEWKNGYYANGVYTFLANYVCSKSPIEIKPNTTYYAFNGEAQGRLVIAQYDINGDFISNILVRNASFTTNSKAYSINFYLEAQLQSYNNNVSINYPASYTDYAPYLGSEYTIEFVDDQGDPITVYKGRINFTTGVLTLDGQIVDMGDLNYTKYDVAEGTLFRTQISGAKLTYNVDNLLCSIYRFATKEQRANGTYSIPDNVGNLDFINDSYTSASDFKTAMSGQTLLFELAEPIEIQLTPTQINNLLGLNQMYADNNGDISVTFSSNGVIQTETGDIVSFNVAVEDMQKGILLNRLVIGDYDKIRLSKGNNTIVLTGGAQQLVIDKYSRWI